jgi:hypothetical protein
MFRFSPQILSEIFLILRKIERNVVMSVHSSACNVPLFLSDFSKTLIFWTEFFFDKYFNHLTPELNPSAQRCLTRFFTGDFGS